MRTVQLADFVSLRRGASYKGALVGDKGVPLLGLGTIAKHGGFKASGVRRYDGDAPDRMLVRGGDLYVSLKDMTQEAALLGAVARVPSDMMVGRLTQDTIALDLDPGFGVDRHYLYWVLRSPRFRTYCRNLGTGTTNLDLSQKDFLSFEMVLPGLDAQKDVVCVLGALDDKIAANRRLVSSLWQMVDARSRLATSAESTIVTLGELIRLNYGRALPVARRRGGAVAVMGSGGEVGRHDEALVPGPSVILGRKGSVGATYWVDGPAYPIDTTYWVEPVGVPLLYAYAVLKSIDFSGMSTDSAVPGLNRDRAYAIPVALPSPERLRTFEFCTASLARRAAAANDENLRLAATRDELLPLLMSGKITVKDAEKTVEEVV